MTAVVKRYDENSEMIYAGAVSANIKGEDEVSTALARQSFVREVEKLVRSVRANLKEQFPAPVLYIDLFENGEPAENTLGIPART